MLDIDCLKHKGSISKTKKKSGNDFKDFASFNSCFYHLDIALKKVILHHWNRLHLVFLLVLCIIFKLLQNLAILAKHMHIETFVWLL